MYIGETSKILKFETLSYPELQNITWLKSSQSIISGEKFEAKSTNILNGYHYENTATLKISDINETDFGDYAIKYLWDGKEFERPVMKLTKGMFEHSYTTQSLDLKTTVRSTKNQAFKIAPLECRRNLAKNRFLKCNFLKYSAIL